MPSEMVMLGILLHPLNASLLIEVIEAGIVMLDVNEEAPRNALLPSVVKPVGMLTLFMPVQFMNAPLPISLRPLGKTTSVIPLQLLNANS